MMCELCGKIIKEGKRANIMGAILTVCDNCAQMGRIISVVKSTQKEKISPEKKTPDKLLEFGLTDYQLVENFHTKIKKAREKMNMKQEDLAKKINEPASLIRRIESNYEPPKNIIEKIENVLKIKLITTPTQDLKIDSKSKKQSNVLTLGDVVKIKKKKI